MSRTRTIFWKCPSVAANNIGQAQTPGASGVVTLNGSLVTSGVANLASGDPSISTGGVNQMRLLWTTTADESAKTLAIVGTKLVDGVSKAITETLTGVNNTSTNSFQDYNTITSLTLSGAGAGSMTFGTGVAAGGPAGNRAIASTPWLRPDTDTQTPFAVSLFITLLSGTATFDVEHTGSRLLPDSGAVLTLPNEFLHSSISAKSASIDGNYAFGVTGVRLRVTASSSGLLCFEVIQVGIIGGPAGALWG